MVQTAPVRPQMQQQQPPRPQVPPKKPALTLEHINRMRERRPLYAAVSMAEPKTFSNGSVLNELVVRVTDWTEAYLQEKYGQDAYVRCKKPFWGANNPRVEWVRMFLEQERAIQQTEYPPTGWVTLEGLHEETYTANDGSQQVKLVCENVGFHSWYGYPDTFIEAPHMPTDEEVKALKAERQQQAQQTFNNTPASTLVDGDEDNY